MKLSTQEYIPVARLGFEKGIKLLKNAGYDCLDLSLFRMDRDDSPYNREDWRSIAEEQRKIADDEGITFNQAHAPHIFNFADSQVMETVATPRIIRSIEIAAIMGAKCIIIHPLHFLDYRTNSEELRRLNLDYYRNLIPVARDYGIKIGFENMWSRDPETKAIIENVGGFAKDLASYIDEIDSPWVTACLDLGHSMLVGEAPEEAIRILGHDRLEALHVHDNDGKSDMHTLPGLGIICWDEVMKALKEINYSGEFTYEADSFVRCFDDELIADAETLMVKVGRNLLSK